MAKTISFDIKLSVDGKEQVVKVGADVKQLAHEIENARASSQRFRDGLANFANFTMGLTNVQNALSSISGAMNSLTAESRSFAGAMRQANTMAGEGAAGFELMKEQVTELSKHIPIARDELARGLYQVISNGVPKDNWISYLEASAKSAVGGIANLEEVVKVTSTIIKNYGMTWDQAMTVQDKIQLTAKNGVTSFEQLAAALPSVTGQAAQLGVSLDEMLAVMSTLTGVTGNTSEVSTQLASVLTALTKESSKSQKMAAAMGIEFNAASVKAAGGLQNYLKELDKTVTAYSKKTGVLRESIYSKLFGRAEALRLVNGLTGEMAAKFDENIAAMKDSLGTMDGAFNEMASTGASKMQQLQNEMSNVRDSLAQFFGTSVVYAEFASQMSSLVVSASMAILAVWKLSRGFYALATSEKVAALASRLWNAAASLGSKVVAAYRAHIISLTTATISATWATRAFRIAIMALEALTGIGLALAALSVVVEALGYAFSESAEEADELSSASAKLKAAQEQANGEVARGQAQLETYIAKLKGMKDGTADADKIVAELNATYGDTIGYFSSVSEWYDALTKNSKAYCDQLVIEAEMRRLANQIADSDAKIRDIRYNPDGTLKYYSTRREKQTKVSNVPNGYGGFLTYQVEGPSELDKANEAIRSETKIKAAARARMAELAEQRTAIVYPVKGSTTPPKGGSHAPVVKDDEDDNKKNGGGKSGGKSGGADKKEPQKGEYLIATPQTYADLENNSAYYKKQIEEKTRLNDTQSVQELARKKAAIDEQIKAFQDLADAANVPYNPKTLEEYGKKLQWLNAAREKADADTLPQIQAEIKATEDAQRAFEQKAAAKIRAAQPESLQRYNDTLADLERRRMTASSEEIQQIDAKIQRVERLQYLFENAELAAMRPSDVKTQEQANRLLAYYDELLRTATEGERENLMRHRADVEKVVTEWSKAAEKIRRAANMPKDPRSVGDLDTAISYKREEQREQTGDEWLKTQREINALEERRAAIERGGDLLTTQRELEELQRLSKKELRVKIQEEGFAGLTSKIQELRRILSDPINPPTKGQRELIEGQIALYEKWRRQAVMSFDTVRSAWDSTKGLGDGVRDLTSALEGNSDAWSTITGVIDSAIKIYDSITAVIDIVKQIVAALTGSKAVEAVGTQAAADVTTEAAIQNAASAAIETAAAKTATSAYMGLAAAKTYAAHAYIPFAGVGIASSMIGVMQGVVAAASIPKFAEGGVVYGPTLALTGEYAGAANNPEIIAPLDKLRDMIQPQGIMAGRVRFEIDGRKLVGVLSNETRVAAKSGRRTNIIG